MKCLCCVWLDYYCRWHCSTQNKFLFFSTSYSHRVTHRTSAVFLIYLPFFCSIYASVLFNVFNKSDIKSGFVKHHCVLQYRESGRAVLEDDKDFVDILVERRHSSDLGYAFRTFNPHPYKGATPCSSGDLNKAVLDSQYLRYMAKQVRLCDFFFLNA